LPHIEFYLPFLERSHLPAVQSAIDTLLHLAFGENASATALAAELQILPAEPLWAASIAKLGGRLQTNLTELQAATSIQALLDHPDLTMLTNSWLHALQGALAFLDLRDHWPRLQPETIQEWAAHHLVKALPPDSVPSGASQYAHLRHPWLTMVEAAARNQAEDAFRVWRAKTDHRAHSYSSETLAGIIIRSRRFKTLFWT
jgi:hypothetical protein